MVRFSIPSAACAVVFLVAACAMAPAQTIPSVSPVALKSRPVPAYPLNSVFALDGTASSAGFAIEIRSAEQMTEADRNLEADAESSIAEHAGFAGLEFNEGPWSYRQIVCPALPNHLFLRFTRNNGAGDVSVFSASIPRNGEGRVRIIPILRRSYSLFSPAPINALTLAAFNHIRLEEHAGDAADWLGTGLCYAALAGANPQVELQSQPLAHAGKTAFPLAMLEVRPGGGDIVRFVDLSARPHPMEWTLIFDAKGRVRKASRAPAPTVESTPVPPALAGQTWVPVPPSGDQPAANVPAQ